MAAERRPSRFNLKTVAFLTAVVAVFVAAFAMTAAYARSGYFVGFRGDDVVVYKGQPGGVLWFDPTVRVVTQRSRDDLPADRQEAIAENPEFDSIDAAVNYVNELPAPDTERRDGHDRRDGDDHRRAGRGREHDPTADGHRLTAHLEGHAVTATSSIAQRRRSTELGLIVMAVVITGSAYTLSALGRDADVPANLFPFLAIILGLLIVAHLATRKFAAGADGTLLPLAAFLNGIGYVMLARLDAEPLRRPAGDVDADRHRRLHRHPHRRAPRQRPAPLPVDASSCSAWCCCCCRSCRASAWRSAGRASGSASARSASSPARSPRSASPSSSPAT